LRRICAHQADRRLLLRVFDQDGGTGPLTRLDRLLFELGYVGVQAAIQEAMTERSKTTGATLRGRGFDVSHVTHLNQRCHHGRRTDPVRRAIKRRRSSARLGVQLVNTALGTIGAGVRNTSQFWAAPV
jgi:hypothetical protein